MNKILKVVLSVILICSVGYLSIVGYQHYDYNQGYAQALIRAIRDFDDEKLNRLLENPKNIDSTSDIRILILDGDNHNPLQEAAAIGNYNAVVALVEAGANVNFINPTTDFTPLLSALITSKSNRITIANYLIDHGADVHHKPNQGGTGNALAESIDYVGIDIEESYALFLRLINLGCDPYVRTNPGNIFLKSAASGNKLIMVYLMENDLFDVNVLNDGGYSALMYLARVYLGQVTLDMIQILIDYGANKTLVNEDGMTAFDYALETGNTELIVHVKY